MLLFFKGDEYYNLLQKSGVNFLHNKNRAYFFLGGLIYKGKHIELVIPFHANISSITQKEGLFLEFNDTGHTKPGKRAGLNLAMAIPHSRKLFREEYRLSTDLKLCENIAKQNLEFLRRVCQEMLNNYEKGISPTHGIKDFDEVLRVLNECVKNIDKNKTKQSKRDNKHKIYANKTVKDNKQQNQESTKLNANVNELKKLRNEVDKKEAAKELVRNNSKYLDSIILKLKDNAPNPSIIKTNVKNSNNQDTEDN